MTSSSTNLVFFLLLLGSLHVMVSGKSVFGGDDKDKKFEFPDGDDKDKKFEVPDGDYDYLISIFGAVSGGRCVTSNMGCLDYVSDCVDNKCKPRVYFIVLLVLIPLLCIGLCCLCVCCGGCSFCVCFLTLCCCCCGGDSEEEEASESESDSAMTTDSTEAKSSCPVTTTTTTNTNSVSDSVMSTKSAAA